MNMGVRRPTITGYLTLIEPPAARFVAPYTWFNVLAMPHAEVPALAAFGAIAGNAAESARA